MGTFFADIVVAEILVLELKVTDLIVKAHEAQVLHYLRASTMEVGLVLTFGEVPKVRRVEMRNERKRSISTIQNNNKHLTGIKGIKKDKSG